MASGDEEPSAFWPLLLAATSGAAGLMHQMLWVRRMVDVLGANAGTFSRVIAAFFLGLALGAWLAARRATLRPWRSVAMAEVGVALLAVVVLFSGAWAQNLSLDPTRARLLTWLLPLLLIGPPAFAMGLVVPWMIRAVGERRAVTLYGVNTLGGLGGLVLAPGWALPALGLAGASVFALSLNLVVGLGAWLLGRRNAREGCGWNPPPARGVLPAVDMATAFASGFLVLGSEVIFQHQFSQVLISSHLSSALVLALVLGGLGVAALLTPWAARLGRGAMPWALALAALLCAWQPFLLIAQRAGLAYLPFEKPFPIYTLEALRLGLPACALVLFPAGFVFPLLLRRAAAAGVDAGWLLAVNGFGGWLGAELSERILAPMFGIWWSMTILGVGYGLCWFWQCAGHVRWWIAPVLASVMAFTWRLDSRLPYAALTPGDTLVSVAVGREGVVGVVRGEPDDWRILFNNTYTLGGSRAQYNQERQTLLPMLLHGEARHVATLGVATGSSLAGATLDPVLVHAEGVELSPLVLRYARDTFAPFNRQVFNDPRVQVTLGDARWVMAQRSGAFDVIEGDLFLPWRTGEGRLFTREHFANVRAALRPDGIFCQWLPMYQLTRPQFEAIVRTFREVFPEAWLVRGDFYVGMPILGLVGGRRFDSIDWGKVAAACERVRAADGCRDPLLRHVEGVAMCVCGPLPAPPPGPINTLANAWLEWNAAKNVIGVGERWFNGVAGATYVREVRRAGAAFIPEGLKSAHAAGDECLALEVARAANLPQAAEAEARFRAALPAALREDSVADWSRWPMRFRVKLP